MRALPPPDLESRCAATEERGWLARAAQGFGRVGASRLLVVAVAAFCIAAICVMWESLLELGTSGENFGQFGKAAHATDQSADTLKAILSELKKQTVQRNSTMV